MFAKLTSGAGLAWPKYALTRETKKPKKGHQDSRSLTSQQRLKLGPGAKMLKRTKTGAGGNFRLNTRADRPVAKTWKIKLKLCIKLWAPSLQQPTLLPTASSRRCQSAPRREQCSSQYMHKFVQWRDSSKWVWINTSMLMQCLSPHKIYEYCRLDWGRN